MNEEKKIYYLVKEHYAGNDAYVPTDIGQIWEKPPTRDDAFRFDNKNDAIFFAHFCNVLDGAEHYSVEEIEV